MSSDSKRDVDVAANLFDWFDARVRDAHQLTGVELSRDSELYLATLLVERARADRPEPPERTLAELHARAARSTPAEQARTYREIGDRSLYVVGYFEESLSRSTVGPSYYCEMGAAAYARADHVFKRWFANAFDGVFEELAHRFHGCVRVLLEIRRTVDEQPDAVMRLYQQWLATGSAELAERLRAHGLVVPARPSEA